MKIYINTTTEPPTLSSALSVRTAADGALQVFNASGGGAVSQLRFKRGTTVPLTVLFPLAAGETAPAAMNFAVKLSGKYDDVLVLRATATEATTPSTGEDAGFARFDMKAEIASSLIDAALGVGGNGTADDLESASFMAELAWKARVVGDAEWLQLFDADAEPCENEPEGAGSGKFIAAAAAPEAGAEARSAEIELLVRDGDAWTRVDVCSFLQGARPEEPDDPEEPETPTLAAEPTRLVFSPLGGSATLTASGSAAAQAQLSIPAEYADAISADAAAEGGGTWTLTAPAAPERTRKISFFAALTAPGAAAAVEIVLLPFPRAARTLPTEPFFREKRLSFFP